MATVVVTGHSGFVGKHLLNRNSYIPLKNSRGENINLLDFEAIVRFLTSIKPNAVIHLAGQSHVPASFENPKLTFDVNFTGTYNLLEALKKTNFKGRFLFVGSADCYGIVPENSLPITEDMPLKPRNPYAVSKVAAEALCYQWSQTSDFEIILARPFNHLGTGQNEHFAIPNFAKQIVEIKLKLKPPILETGRIDVTRDFIDVQDVLSAYQLLLNKGNSGEVYNICSGREYSIKSLVEMMLDFYRINVDIIYKPERARAIEQTRMCGSWQKINAHTCWKPLTPISKTIQTILLDLEQKYEKVRTN